MQNLKTFFIIALLLHYSNVIFATILPINNINSSLYNQSTIAYSNCKKIDINELKKLKFNVFNKSLLLKFPITDTLQYAIIQFRIENNTNKPKEIFIKTLDDISYMQLYKIKKSHVQSLGGTGYAFGYNKLSVENDERRIHIFIDKNSTQNFIIQLKKYKYKLTIPEIKLQDRNNYLEEISKSNNSKIDFYIIFGIIMVGFQFAFFFYGLAKIVFYEPHKVYVYFTLLFLVLILYYLSKSNLCIFESQYLPFISNNMFYESMGDLQIVVFNILVIALFDLQYNQFLYKFLIRINFFWILLFFIEILPFSKIPLIITCSRFILNIAAIVDFVTLLMIFSLAFKNRKGFRKFIFIGILIMMISSFEIAYPRILNLFYLDPNWIKLSKSSYFLLQICDNVNFFLIVIAFVIKDKEIQQQNHLLELQQQTTTEELKKMRQLVVKENIILKDKTKINLDQLLYIKSDDHYLNIFTIDNKKHFVRGKLSDVATELPGNFVKCHKSFIVNKNFIIIVSNTFLKMTNDFEVPLSRNFKLME